MFNPAMLFSNLDKIVNPPKSEFIGELDKKEIESEKLNLYWAKDRAKDMEQEKTIKMLKKESREALQRI